MAGLPGLRGKALASDTKQMTNKREKKISRKREKMYKEKKNGKKRERKMDRNKQEEIKKCSKTRTETEILTC